MTDIYLHFTCAHYGLSGNAPVLLLMGRAVSFYAFLCDSAKYMYLSHEAKGMSNLGVDVGNKEARDHCVK